MLNVLLCILTVLAVSAGHAAAEPSAEEIVARADGIRFPNADFSVNITINTMEGAEVKNVNKYEVLIKGKDKCLIKATYPLYDRGKCVLMRGLDLWVYLPTARNPVRMSLQQRLIGQVAYGDIARINFSGDYEPKLKEIEKIEDKAYYVLELTAKDPRLPYNKATYWVEKANFRPYKAEFYSVSGRLLKAGYYEDYKQVLGCARPMRLVLEDAIQKNKRSVLEYTDMRYEDFPEKMFTHHYLKKLE